MKFEKGDRAISHNNPGAIIWSPNLEREMELEGISISKGESFVGQDGRTYYYTNNNTIRLRTLCNGKLIEDTISGN